MSKIQLPRVRRELLEGPATCQELADVLDMPLRAVHVALWVLQCQKNAVVTGKIDNEHDGRKWKSRNLYELTPLGRYLARKMKS